jgi:4-hydroxyproline epimerase
MQHRFKCIDAHTCGNPVRVVTSGHPELRGETMSEKRADFLARFDWIRTALMFEPRGHDMMSGAFIYPPLSPDADAAFLFIETSGCLPMCGHGTIGTVTVAVEQALLEPATEGRLVLEVPAGRIEVTYQREGDRVVSVKIFNIASFLAHRDIEINCPELGQIKLDVAYGGNFYAIIEPQDNYPGLDRFSPDQILRLSPAVRELVDQAVDSVHPEDPSIRGCSHVLWTGPPRDPGADAANAVFYGARAIDRSPCGTGTSARMAQLYALGKLPVGRPFVHESIIGSQFVGRVEDETRINDQPAILPSIEGWARITGFNEIIVDEDDPFAHGFTVT